MMNDNNKNFIKPTKEIQDLIDENERLKILLYNMADVYLLEMSESELREFLTIEIGFTESEYDSYIKKY